MGNLSQDSHPSGGASHHHVTYPYFFTVLGAYLKQKFSMMKKSKKRDKL
jgi:hypothetical protein